MSRFRSFLHSVARPNIPWGNVLRGVTSANFWLSLVGMAILIVFLWCFDLIDELYSRIAIVGLYSVIPASVLKQATGDGSKSRPFDWILFWFVLFLFAALLIAIGDRFDWAPLVINVAAVVTAFPLALASWLSIRKQLLLAVGLVPAALMAVVYLGIQIFPSDVRLDYSLLLLPYVLLGVAPWAFVASRSLTRAQRLRQCAIHGPAIEVFTMLVLFIPLIVLVVLTTRELTDDEIWLAVSITIVGVFLSSIVSVPLRQFLLDLGKLAPNHKWKE